MNKVILFLISTVLIFSCKREVVDAPDFSFNTDAATYHVGDSVKFNFSGDPHDIVFWSGQVGHVYEYRSRTFVEGNKLLVKFNTFQSFGTVSNNLQVKASDDFNGVYDTTSIKAATWKDITDKVVLSAGADQVPSGTVNLSDLFDGKKPVTIAFRYFTTKTVAQNRWVIRTINIDNQNAAGVVTPLATMSTAGWKAVSFQNSAAVWSVTSAQLLIQGSTAVLDDDWVLTKSFNPSAVVPDKGLAVKNITFDISSYSEVYKVPGTYKVTFEATNASYQNQEKVIKEMTLTILP